MVRYLPTKFESDRFTEPSGAPPSPVSANLRLTGEVIVDSRILCEEFGKMQRMERKVNNASSRPIIWYKFHKIKRLIPLGVKLHYPMRYAR